MTVPTDPAGVAQQPVCPRHPGVVSYVRCARCGRPACPQCQRPAAVGIQCVDCVREGNASVRRPQGRFGGAVETGGAPITLALVVLCVVLYVLQQLVPGLTSRLLFVSALGDSEPWRFLTAAFLHASPTHILFNMLALWQVGTGLERDLGRWRYLALYLLSALAGSVGYLLLSAPPTPLEPLGTNWFQPTVGASGAVFGLFGAELVLARRLRRDVRGMLVWLGINVVLGFMYPGIAWQAHLGGFVMGCLVALVLGGLADRTRRRLQWPALGGLALLLLVLTVVRYQLAG